MKKLTIILLAISFMLPVIVFAQKADSTRNNSVKRIYDLVKAKGKPVIVIDGIIYNENSKPFDTDSIADTYVLNPPGSENIYGVKGKDGAILIATKSFRTANSTISTPVKSDTTTYVLNGKLSNEQEVETLDPDMILNIGILKYDKSAVAEEFQGKTKFVVTTKAYATKYYQDKLSHLSKQYEQYLARHHDDDKLLFVINGVQYQSSSRERIEKLYKLFSDNLIIENFKLTYVEGSTSNPSSLNINTNSN
jgi:signal recognition particle receptor subunit beta